ncbi:DnaJ domain containing protein [Nitzschia inconspicua]|nr:DnaJ domain containing protein [Nitzschia inconspicua]
MEAERALEEARRITPKAKTKENEMRERIREESYLSECTFKPKTQWDLIEERRQQAALSPAVSSHSRDANPISKYERERMERHRKYEESELEHCTFFPVTNWKSQKGVKQTNGIANYAKEFDDTFEKLLDSNKSSRPETPPTSDSAQHSVKLVSVENFQEVSGKNADPPTIVRQNMVRQIVSPKSPEWKKKYRKIGQKAEMESKVEAGGQGVVDSRKRGHAVIKSPGVKPAESSPRILSPPSSFNNFDVPLENPRQSQEEVAEESDGHISLTDVFKGEVTIEQQKLLAEQAMAIRLAQKQRAKELADEERRQEERALDAKTTEREVEQVPNAEVPENTPASAIVENRGSPPKEKISKARKWYDRMSKKLGKKASTEDLGHIQPKTNEQPPRSDDGLDSTLEGEEKTRLAVKTSRVTEEQARLAAEAKARRLSEEQARLMAEAEAKRIAQEQAKLAAEEEEKRLAEEQARLAEKAEAEAKRIAQEQARLAAGEEEKRLAEEQARLAAEAEAEAKRIAQEQARLAAEEEEKRLAEEQARLAAEAEAEAKRIAQEQARLAAEEEEKRLAEEQARLAAEAEAEAKRIAQEQARLAAEAEAKRIAQGQARLAAEEEEKRLAEEQARLAAEEEEKRLAEEQARLAAEAEAKTKRIAQEQARLAAEAEANRLAEEQARLAAEEEAARIAEEQARLAAEEEANRLAEEQARLAAEEEAAREAEEQARLAAEAEANRLAEEQARLVAEAAREAEEQARLAAEAEANRLAEEQAKLVAEAAREAEEQARLAAEAEANRLAEEQARLAAEDDAAEEAAEQVRLAAKAEARRAAEEQARLAAEAKSLAQVQASLEAVAFVQKEKERHQLGESTEGDAMEVDNSSGIKIESGFRASEVEDSSLPHSDDSVDLDLDDAALTADASAGETSGKKVKTDRAKKWKDRLSKKKKKSQRKGDAPSDVATVGLESTDAYPKVLYSDDGDQKESKKLPEIGSI